MRAAKPIMSPIEACEHSGWRLHRGGAGERAMLSPIMPCAFQSGRGWNCWRKRGHWDPRLRRAADSDGCSLPTLLSKFGQASGAEDGRQARPGKKPESVTGVETGHHEQNCHQSQTGRCRTTIRCRTAAIPGGKCSLKCRLPLWGAASARCGSLGIRHMTKISTAQIRASAAAGYLAMILAMGTLHGRIKSILGSLGQVSRRRFAPLFLRVPA